MKILITGGAGFIGSHLVRYLFANTDYEIVVLDALTYAGNTDNIPMEIYESPRFKFVYGTIMDPLIVRHCMKDCDIVFHLAAETHVTRSIYNAGAFIDTDVKGTQVMLDAAKELQVEDFIHMSTSEVYGTAMECPMTESHPLNPRSPYAASKCGADRLAYSYICTFDMPVTIVRPFNNYGPNQHPEKLIPHIITSWASGRKPHIYGNGSAQRDWVYVGDCVDALYKILESKKFRGKVVNIATSNSYSVNDILSLILKKFPGSECDRTNSREGEVSKHQGSYSLLYDTIGWKQRVNFRTGLDLTVDWYVRNMNWWGTTRIQQAGRL